MINYDCCYEIIEFGDLLSWQKLKLINRFFKKLIEKQTKKRKCVLEIMEINCSNRKLCLNYSNMNGLIGSYSLFIPNFIDKELNQMIWINNRENSKIEDLTKYFIKLRLFCKTTIIQFKEQLDKNSIKFFLLFLKSIEEQWCNGNVILKSSQFNNDLLVKLLKELLKNVLIDARFIGLYNLPISSYAIYYYIHNISKSSNKTMEIKECNELNSLKLFSILNWSLMVRIL